MITIYKGTSMTLDQLAQVELQRPKRAGTVWQGIPHHNLVQTIVDEVHSRGWKTSDMRFAVSKDKADMAGTMNLTIPTAEVPEGMGLSLGIVTSNAMRKQLKLVVGTTVRVCLNGMVTGQIVVKRKHTTGLDLFEEVEHGLDLYHESIRHIPTLVASLRQRELSPAEAEHLLLEAGRRGLIPWSHLGRVDQQYRQPRFKEHGSGTSWALLNAYTYIIKGSNPLHQMDSIDAFRSMLPTAQVA